MLGAEVGVLGIGGQAHSSQARLKGELYETD